MRKPPLVGIGAPAAAETGNVPPGENKLSCEWHPSLLGNGPFFVRHTVTVFNRTPHCSSRLTSLIDPSYRSLM